MTTTLSHNSLHWIAFLGSCPTLACSESSLERRFATEWVDARSLSTRSTRGANPYREVYAGVAEDSVVSAVGVAQHVRSDRWSCSSEFGASPILNFLHLQRADGALPTKIRYGRCPEYGVVVPDWSVFWDHFLVHPDERFLRRVYHGMSDYSHFVDSIGDSENATLIDAELLVEREETIFLRGHGVSTAKGLGNSVNQYKLKYALGQAAQRLGMQFDATSWFAQADELGDCIRNYLWDPLGNRFCDRIKGSGEFRVVEVAQACLPFIADIAQSDQMGGLPDIPFVGATRTNRNDRGRSTTEQLPSLEAMDVVEAFFKAGLRFGNVTYVDKAAAHLLRVARVLSSPPSAHRFRADAPWVGNSWFIRDLIVRYVVGINPHADGITVQPLEFPIDTFTIDKLVIRNNHVGVWRSGDRFGVRLDGEEIANATVGEAIELDIPL